MKKGRMIRKEKRKREYCGGNKELKQKGKGKYEERGVGWRDEGSGDDMKKKKKNKEKKEEHGVRKSG